MLILDNAEEILDARYVAELLQRAPAIKLLVTSREALNLQQEWFQPIGGLQLADQDGESRDADAVMLFAQAALRANPNFDLEQALGDVNRICRLVDGVPLAIELAATWLRVLTGRQIAEALAEGLDLLAVSQPDVPARHRSMRTVLSQTWAHLTGEEQAGFARLSVFAGGFQADAAEVIADASVWTLAALVDKSVIQLRQDGRYRVHTLLRQVGMEKLKDNPAALQTTIERHADFYLSYLGDRCHSISGREQRRVMSEIQLEMENIRIAWLHVASQDRLDRLGDAHVTLYRYLWTRGRYDEGETLFRAAAEITGQKERAEQKERTWITLCARQAQFAAARSAFDQTPPLLTDAMNAALAHQFAAEEALCNYVAGFTAQQMENEETIAHYSAAYRFYREHGKLTEGADTALRLGYAVYYFTGNLTRCRQLIDEALQLYRKGNDLAGLADALDSAGWTAAMVGRFDEAELYYRECMALAQEVDSRLTIAKAIGGMSWLALIGGDEQSAIRLMQERLQRMRDLGHAHEVSVSLDLLANIYIFLGQDTEAVALLPDYPQNWRTAIKARIQILSGSYSAAMDYLTDATQTYLRAANPYELSAHLLSWAMLLTGDCRLSWQTDTPGTRRLLGREERVKKACETLCALRFYEKCEFEAHKLAQRLLSRISEVDNNPCRSSMPTDYAAIERLAKEMLQLRLG